MGNDYLVKVGFKLKGVGYVIETAFVENEVSGFCQEFECNEEHALKALSRIYLLEHYGREAELDEIKYRRGYE